MANLNRLIELAGLTQRQVAAALAMDESVVSRKLAGQRPWRLNELKSLQELLSEKLARAVSLDEMATDTTPTEEPAA